MGRPRKEHDLNLVYRVAELFFQGVKAQKISDHINKEFNPTPKFNRESVYPMLVIAKEKNILRLIPPVENTLKSEICKKFNLPEKHITVVYSSEDNTGANVAAKAAEIALDFIEEIGSSTNKPVGIGLGPGSATLDFCRYLKDYVQTEIYAPLLNLYAISAGGSAFFPQYASISFFNLFPPKLVKQKVGLFAETLVPTQEYDEIINRPIVSEAFKQRDAVDIVVTGMGDMNDQHDLLRGFLEKNKINIQRLIRQGWIGNVQYRPFSVNGPIHEKKNEMRAVTLFELEDFVDLAKTKDKHVILIARKCGGCGNTRVHALLPLLVNPNLKVWSEIVMDGDTAKDLLKL
ncbi:MAG: hypothetical protein JXR73_21300 [Candidatus Omnitrophica bacterium]|nr:hypothetical protein [Candidatus Omnitrophota bacterium]